MNSKLPMKYLFGDTETDTLWVEGAGERDPRQPRPLQVAFATYNESGQELAAATAIIAPLSEWPNPSAESVSIHGINPELRARGINPIRVREMLVAVGADSTCVFVGHNVGFDIRVLRRFWLELDQQTTADYILNLPAYDTMYSAIEVCRLPKEHGGSGYKRPTLTELHQFLFAEDLPGAHDALVDIRASARCFFELLHRGVVPQPPQLPSIEGERDQDEVRRVLGNAALAKKSPKEADFVKQQVERLQKYNSLSPSDAQWKWLLDIASRVPVKPTL